MLRTAETAADGGAAAPDAGPEASPADGARWAPDVATSDAGLADGQGTAFSDASVDGSTPATDATVDDSSAAGEASTTTGTPSCPAPGPGLSDCGPNGGESCCASLLVPMGTFDRGDVDPSSGPRLATISDFRLDRFEVTVGRFRPFVAALASGWQTPPGSGKHAYLNGGRGLLASRWNDAGPDFEQGWDPAWDTHVQPSPGTAHLEAPGPGTWTDAPGANEALPVTGVTWYTAYAFCIWDGGFLPSEAEWDYAAAGGSEQRSYPWGSELPDCTRANFIPSLPDASPAGCVGVPNRVGSESPLGDGRWGHADLNGNVAEWALDVFYASLPTATFFDDGCHDCVALLGLSPQDWAVFRGAAFWGPLTSLFSRE